MDYTKLTAKELAESTNLGRLENLISKLAKEAADEGSNMLEFTFCPGTTLETVKEIYGRFVAKGFDVSYGGIAANLDEGDISVKSGDYSKMQEDFFYTYSLLLRW